MRLALVGLGFGAEFVPIYLHHPEVESLTICDGDPAVLAAVGDRFGVERRATSLAQVLDDPRIDAVHITTPIPLHARQAIASLEAGKHCACTVPMATSLAEIRAVVEAQGRSGRTYMMMETAVYTREFLMVREMHARGDFGRIQFLRGAHYQDMEEWPPYWRGLPPMHYATHAIAPLVVIAGRRMTEVRCLGSGRMRSELHEPYGNPYPVETAVFRLEGGELAAEVTRSLFHTARSYTEAFTVYGEDATFEWQQIEEEEPILFRMGKSDGSRGRPVSMQRVAAPDRAELLPEPIRRFTRSGVYDASDPHRSFLQGGGHGGSHPHLVHEFLSSIREGRRPLVDAVVAADITAAGVCAHESAMRAGERVEIPSFSYRGLY